MSIKLKLNAFPTYLFLVLQALALICSVPALAKPAKMITSTSGQGAKLTRHEPSYGEIISWKQHNPNLSLESPNGQYQVVKVIGHDYGPTVFNIVNKQDGKVILTAKGLGQLLGDQEDFDAGHSLYFDGWLPNSGLIAVSAASHISSDDFWSHAVVDVAARRVIMFNGWLSPDLKYGIVPNKNGRVNEYFQHYTLDSTHRIDTKGDLHWYVTPMPRDIRRYRFSTAIARPILLDGKPFHLFHEILTNMNEEDPAHQRPSIVFSPDCHWALCRSYDTDYVLSLTTGEIRKVVPPAVSHSITEDMRKAIVTYLVESQEDPHPQLNRPFKILSADVEGTTAYVRLSLKGLGNHYFEHDVIVWKPKSSVYDDVRKRNGGWYARQPIDIPPSEIPPTLEKKWHLDQLR